VVPASQVSDTDLPPGSPCNCNLKGGELTQKAVLLLCCVFFASTLACRAQRIPKVEVFGGYFHLGDALSSTTDPLISCLAQTSSPCDNRFDNDVGLNGWQASLTENAKSWLGITEEFAGYYGTSSIRGADHRFNAFSVLAGPRVSLPYAKLVTPFAHALFGYGQMRVSEGSAGSATGRSFAFALGGGLDANLTHHVGIRLVQVDYYRTAIFAGTQNNVRVSAGVFFRFGK